MKCILIIAGSDTSGGAGIQADIKTAYKLGYHAVTIISALTAQNSLKVSDIMPVSGEFILKQMNTVLEDIKPDAVKIGMLFSINAIKKVAETISKYNLSPVVLDPILKASTGAWLLEKGNMEELKNRLFPLVDVITPNIYEAELLSNVKIKNMNDIESAAKILNKMGSQVVITGYHIKDEVIDIGYNGKDFFYIKDKSIDAKNAHGSGCIYSTSLSIFIAEGYSLTKAARLAHDFTKDAIKKGYSLGKGSGPAVP